MANSSERARLERLSLRQALATIREPNEECRAGIKMVLGVIANRGPREMDESTGSGPSTTDQA